MQALGARRRAVAFSKSRKSSSIGQIFATIEQELRSQYYLGFVSDQPVRISEFRTLQLAAKRKDLIVQARDRYWAQR